MRQTQPGYCFLSGKMVAHWLNPGTAELCRNHNRNLEMMGDFASLARVGSDSEPEKKKETTFAGLHHSYAERTSGIEDSEVGPKSDLYPKVFRVGPD